jgi:hypothetical protein
MLLVGTTGWIGAAVRPASAQLEPGELRERLELQLQRTDEMLKNASDLVVASESERARRLLDNALVIQESAWELYARCGTENLRACRNASEATTRARREVRHAIQVAREQSTDERAAQQAIDRAQQLLEQAWSSLHDDAAGDAALRATRLLEQAQAQLDRALEQFRERHFAVARLLAESAGRLVQQGVAFDSDESLDAGRVERELERTDRLLERAAPVIRESGRRPAMQLVERATELQARAKQALDQHRPWIAVRLTREARQQVRRALRMVDGPVDPELVAQAVEQTDALITRAAPVVRESAVERAIELLERGIQRQARARTLEADGELHAALAQTRVARRLVQEALDRVEHGTDATP